MSLRQLKWITVLGPLVFLTGLDLLRHLVLPDLLHSMPGYILVAGVVLLGTLLFSEMIFGVIARMQERLEQQNREVLALHQASLDIASDLSLETVLQKVVEQARDLVGARYGALSHLAPDSHIQAFLTSGITNEERQRIGPVPEGHGLLSVVMQDRHTLRLRDLTKDPRSVGFPEHHPVMRSLLAVPIVSDGRTVGNLYVTEKEDAPEFTPEDEETLTRFASTAALAIENARLHRQVRDVAITEERERIAREMHDSLAQVLGYVITKAQAIQEFLRSGRVDRAEAQVRQLADAAQSAYADVREGILSLRTSPGPQHGFLDALQEYLRRWEEQSEVKARLEIVPPGATLESLSAAAELQVLRIIQESLANVRKHAGASHATVRLTENGMGVSAMVEDDGRGFDPGRLGGAEFPRFGLATMRERAEAVGGSLEIDSAAGRGTRVVVRVPTEVVPLRNGESLARSNL